MHQLTTTVGIIAMGAAAVAIVALIWGLWLSFALARLRGAQRMVLGDHNTDLVDHAARLERDFRALNGYVEDVLKGVAGRVSDVEQRLDGAVSHLALVRYDAYGEMSGRQSSSIALLDARRSGIVLTSIHHRDQARMYVKQINAGQPEIELSPEEAEAVRLALSRDAQPQGAMAADLATGRTRVSGARRVPRT